MENPLRGRGQARGPTPPLPCQIPSQFRGPRTNQQEIRPASVDEVGQISNRISSSERGSRGQPTKLISNYFPITNCTDWTLYQYRVDFNPVQERTNIQRGLLSRHKKFLGAYIFDRTILFSIRKFESDTTELISKRNTDDQTVIITLKFTSVIKKGDYASIQVFNLLMRKCFSNLNLTLTGGNCYDADVKITIPNHKLQLLPGYQTTIGLFDSGPVLRSEMKSKIIGKDTVLDFLIESSKTRNVNPNWMDTKLRTNFGNHYQKNDFGRKIEGKCNVEILVLEENSEISTKDPRILLNYTEWKSPRTFTDPSTGETVILPFALKRLNKRKQLNTPLVPVQMKTPLPHDVYESTKIMNKIDFKETIQSNHSHNHHESPYQVKSVHKAIPLPPPEITNDSSNDV